MALLSAVALLFCSKSSPLYPINDWSDANTYFSVGKGMLEGRVTYRDLYDHKGPLLYALHALCALVSHGSFTGVFVLEVLCAAAFLTAAERLLALYGAKQLRVPAVALLLLVYASYSFQQGDSAEELCLPLMLWSMYALLRHIREDGERPMPFAAVMANGVLFGCVFWTKFTLCGLHGAFLLMLVARALKRRNGRLALRCIGGYLSGFMLSTLPWLIYFGLNGAIMDWLKTYLYDNLFLYSGGEATGLLSRVKDIGKSGLDWLWQNPWYTVPLVFGLGWALCRHDAVKGEKPAIMLMAAMAALGVFVGGKSYPYYGLALAALAPLGLIAPCLWLERRQLKLGMPLKAGFCALCVACAALVSPNPETSLFLPRKDTMQYKLAAVIQRYDHPTLLNYGFMDAGFYTASGVTPNVKYFHQTNVPLQEMLDEQIRYIDEGVCDFVVTRGKQPPSIDKGYELVATADSPEGFWYEHVYLYRRIGLQPGQADQR